MATNSLLHCPVANNHWPGHRAFRAVIGRGGAPSAASRVLDTHVSIDIKKTAFLRCTSEQNEAHPYSSSVSERKVHTCDSSTVGG